MDFNLPKIMAFLMSLSLTFLLGACGGGGGGSSSSGSSSSSSGGNQPTSGLSVSSNSISFSASLTAPKPSNQIISGTATGIDREVRVDIVIDGTAIDSADFSFTSSTTGQLSIVPKYQDEIGIGETQDRIRIYMCYNLDDCTTGDSPVPGSPQTIDVSYNVSAPANALNFASPYLGTSNKSREVYLRGYGFSDADTLSVYFGDNEATNVRVINDTTLLVDQPALAAGEYSISIQGSSENIPSIAKILIADESAPFPEATVVSPDASTGLNEFVYDPTRNTIYSTTDSSIIKFTFQDGTWTSETFDIGKWGPSLGLSSDYQSLIVVGANEPYDNYIDRYDPDTLELISSFSVDDVEYIYVSDIEVASNGIVIMPTANYLTYRYNLLTHQLQSYPDGGEPNFTGKALRISHDRNTIVGFQNGHYHYEYNSLLGDMQIIPQFGLGADEGYNIDDALLNSDASLRVQIERQGSFHRYRVIQDEQEVGVIIPEGNTTEYEYSYALNKEGNQLYSIVSENDYFGNQPPTSVTLNIYDLNNPDGSGGFNHIEGSPHDITDFGNIGSRVILTDNEENLLFLYGQGFKVLRLP